MKELSIEQKAKAYDEALAWMRDLYPTMEGAMKEDAEHYFPELKESEDEKIRKELIDIVAKSPITFAFEDKNKVLSWLEKQGEQKPAEWSEDDENRLNHIIQFLEDKDRWKDTERAFPIEEDVRWLKFLKDRIQPMQGWSEEDERIKNNLLSELFNLSVRKLIKKETEKKYASWLKSLRPQNWTKEDKEIYISCLQRLGTGNPEQPETINSKWFKEHVYPQPTWKPSKEQTSVLSRSLKYINTISPNYCHVLEELLAQLKKLREG